MSYVSQKEIERAHYYDLLLGIKPKDRVRVSYTVQRKDPRWINAASTFPLRDTVSEAEEDMNFLIQQYPKDKYRLVKITTIKKTIVTPIKSK